ncbi:hypothetical protein D9619_008298 [Psilocybe cf. subviscida]|uniref:Uncharacterized protein n=1 Tax=Psilocybe cf. subviscida TaxID=2480587 RepID=A0A8H5B9L8_9AGAR|nr:hypothetical protein D9619_008298 [Psilocybe cf. subviscida]
MSFEKLQTVIELVTYIVSLTDWDTFIALSRVNRNIRSQMFYWFRHNAKRMLLPFVPIQSHTNFWNLLTFTNGIIAGWLVRCMTDIAHPRLLQANHPGQMDIIVPRAVGHKLSYTLHWTAFLLRLGYRDVTKELADHLRKRFTVNSQKFVVFKMASDINSPYIITLLESKTSSALPPLLDADCTSTFMALSPTRLYNFYPKLFRRHDDFTLDVRLELNHHGDIFPLQSFHFGLVTYSSDSLVTIYQCDEACRSGVRRTFGLSGVEVFRWGGPDGMLDRGSVVSLVNTTVGWGNFDDDHPPYGTAEAFAYYPVDPREQHKEISSTLGYTANTKFLRELSWSPVRFGGPYVLRMGNSSISADVIIVGMVLAEDMFVEAHGDFELNAPNQHITDACACFCLGRPTSSAYTPYATDFDHAVDNIRNLGASRNFSTTPFLQRNDKGAPVFHLSGKIFEKTDHPSDADIETYEIDEKYKPALTNLEKSYKVSLYDVRDKAGRPIEPNMRRYFMLGTVIKVHMELVYDEARGMRSKVICVIIL